MLFRRPSDVLVNQVSVDGDRRPRSSACRGDHLSARIDHIAGGPDTEGASPAGGIDNDKASLVDVATQAGKQTISMRQVARPDEDRCSRDHSGIVGSSSRAPEAGVVGGLMAVTVVVAFAFGLSWLFAAIGLLMRAPNAVSNAGNMALSPLVFLSNVFVATETLPRWLKAFVEVSPISHLATAARALMA